MNPYPGIEFIGNETFVTALKVAPQLPAGRWRAHLFNEAGVQVARTDTVVVVDEAIAIGWWLSFERGVPWATALRCRVAFEQVTA